MMGVGNTAGLKGRKPQHWDFSSLTWRWRWCSPCHDAPWNTDKTPVLLTTLAGPQSMSGVTML